MKNSTISFIVIGLFFLYNGICSFEASDGSEIVAWLICSISLVCIYKQNKMIEMVNKTIKDLLDLRNKPSEPTVTVTNEQFNEILGIIEKTVNDLKNKK
jgi:hypothetical protein